MKTVLSFKMNVVKLILVYMFVWMANRAFFSAATVSASAETLPDYSAFSNLLQSRMKRDDHYHMKCHQSGTGNSMVNKFPSLHNQNEFMLQECFHFLLCQFLWEIS